MNYVIFDQLCRQKGTTPTALASKLGLSKGNTSSWKKGGNPSAEILIKLADELDCTVDILLGRNDNNSGFIIEDNTNSFDTFVNTGNIQNSDFNNNSGILTNGDGNHISSINTVNSENSLNEEIEVFSEIYKSLPIRLRNRLMGLIYDFEEKHSNEIKKKETL